jgi:hypothetical protein
VLKTTATKNEEKKRKTVKWRRLLLGMVGVVVGVVIKQLA